jgi:hypothetical protein
VSNAQRPTPNASWTAKTGRRARTRRRRHWALGVTERDASRRVPVHDWKPIVGTPAQVCDAITEARATGQLELMTRPQQVPGDAHRVYVHIRMRDQPVPVPVRRWPVIVGGGAALAVSTAATVLAVAWVINHWVHILGTAAVALFFLVVLSPRRRLPWHPLPRMQARVKPGTTAQPRT